MKIEVTYTFDVPNELRGLKPSSAAFQQILYHNILQRVESATLQQALESLEHAQEPGRSAAYRKAYKGIARLQRNWAKCIGAAKTQVKLVQG